MALSGWTRKCQITVAANKITTTATDQVLLFTAAHFPSGMLTLGGSDACRSDGNDIRFALDADATTLLPYDLINISLSATPANSILVVAIKFPSITANTSFSFYAHWGNSSADAPAKTSASGAATCWSMFYGVIPLKEDPTLYTTANAMWKCFKESTGNYSSGSKVGAPTQVAGPVPGMKALAISTLGGVQIPEVAATNRGGFQFAILANVTAPITGAYFAQTNTAASDGFSFDAGVGKVQYAGNWNLSFTDQAGSWTILRTRFNTAGTVDVFLGTKTTNITWAGPFTTLQYIGSGSASLTFSGCLMMLSLFSTVADSFYTNLLNSVTNNATLATPGTIQVASVSATLSFTNLQVGSEVRVYKSSDMTELGGIESCTTSTWSLPYTYTGAVEIHIIHLNYLFILMNTTLDGSSMSIPVQQTADRVYFNPT